MWPLPQQASCAEGEGSLAPGKKKPEGGQVDEDTCAQDQPLSQHLISPYPGVSKFYSS